MKRETFIIIPMLLVAILALAPLMATSANTTASFTLKFLSGSTAKEENILIGFTEKDISTVKDFTSAISDNDTSKSMKAFGNILDTNKSFVITETTTASDTMGYISYYSTSTTGGTVTIVANHLTSTADEEENPYGIDYTLFVGNAAYDTANPEAISLVIPAGSPSTPKYHSYAVRFSPLASSFENAPGDDYSGKIIVSLASN
jgi:hypothetical protein